MQTVDLKLYTLSYSQTKTYLIVAAFVVGNIVFPQICHLIPQGGLILLPIYFFTLIAAYKYGWKAGLLTAVLSPVVNYVLFGMPAVTVLSAILTKSIFLAFASSLAAHYFHKISIPILLLVVLSYQIFGALVEWAIIGDFFVAIQDFRIGFPGMLIQIFGAYFLIKYLLAEK